VRSFGDASGRAGGYQVFGSTAALYGLFASNNWRRCAVVAG